MFRLFVGMLVIEVRVLRVGVARPVKGPDAPTPVLRGEVLQLAVVVERKVEGH